MLSGPLRSRIFLDFEPHLGKLEVAKSKVFTLVSVHFLYSWRSPLGRHLGPILAPFLLPKTSQDEAKLEPSWRKIGPERLLESPEQEDRQEMANKKAKKAKNEAKKPKIAQHGEISLGDAGSAAECPVRRGGKEG